MTGLLRGTWRIENSKIVVRIGRLRLSRRDQLRADAILRRLWPGLVPISRRIKGPYKRRQRGV